MGPKKETLLRWVNCCFEDETPIDKIKNLSDGTFFLYVLGFLRSHYITNSPSWLQIVTILRDHNVTDEVIDFESAELGNEDELAKLIIVCMHLTMVQKPCDFIKEKTMINMSTEDQKILESILSVTVNDDFLTQARLTEVLQDSGIESRLSSKPITIYASSPLSSVPRSSPLKRFLDSPMALRLTRLQREINEKNEEIRRLQSEVMAESDESSALRQQMEHVNRRVKELEKKNAELTQRLRDCQIPESAPTDADVEINQLKKQLKKSQNEYELSCQKYCDLNLEYEALKSRQEKDRKQIRQLQVELNEAVARFERESAEYQLLLDSIRTENVELKHILEEKTQWIEVLEERNRSHSETHYRMIATPITPCERESIGFSLLSIETEQLQLELETCRRDLLSQYNSFDAERRQYQQQVGTLRLENSQLTRQMEKVSLMNSHLRTELQEATTSLEKISQCCSSLRQEKSALLGSLESLNAEFQREKETAQRKLESHLASNANEILKLTQLVQSLERQLEQTKQEKCAVEEELKAQISVLTVEKESLQKKKTELEQVNDQLTTDLSAEREKTCQIKRETTLEHRKEKAALEAKLQFTQAQMKSMQEKLIDMTVTSTRPRQEPDTSVFTRQLEAASKAKDDELDALQKKYESTEKALLYKEEVISQYADKFEKMRAQLMLCDEQMSSLTAENRKLSFQNRTLETEQRYLLAQLAAEKDKANEKATRHLLALQHELEGTDGGSLADVIEDARSRKLRLTRSDAASTLSSRTSSEADVFRAPSLTSSDGSATNGAVVTVCPSGRESLYRRDSLNSLCSTPSDASCASRLPQGAGRFFTCDDEDGEQFSNLYLNELKQGRCKVEDPNARLSELHRRNTMLPPHMRSAYPAEMNDERLRCPELAEVKLASESASEGVDRTSQPSTSDHPNKRKRHSSSLKSEAAVVQLSKRRSLDDVIASSVACYSTALATPDRRKHRDAGQTTYQRPGPPTPAKNLPKESANAIVPSDSPLKVAANRTVSAPSQTKQTSGSLWQKMSGKFRNHKLLTNEVSFFARFTLRDHEANSKILNVVHTPTAATPRSRSKLKFFKT